MYQIKDLSKALQLLIITAKNRFASSTFSVWSGLKSWSSTLYDLVDLLIGLPHKKVVPYQVQLSEEFQKFLLADLIIDVIICSAFILTVKIL